MSLRINATAADFTATTEGEIRFIAPAVTDEGAEKLYPQGFREVEPYLHHVDQSD